MGVIWHTPIDVSTLVNVCIDNYLQTVTVHSMNMTRKKRLVSFALDPELIRRLELWQASQDFAPTKTAIIEHALRQFLDAKKG